MEQAALTGALAGALAGALEMKLLLPRGQPLHNPTVQSLFLDASSDLKKRGNNFKKRTLACKALQTFYCDGNGFKWVSGSFRERGECCAELQAFDTCMNATVAELENL